MGRKKIPDQMKLLRGTAQPCRLSGVGQGGFELLAQLPKSGLKGAAKKIYEDAGGQLIACGVLDKAALPILAAYAREMGLYYTLMVEMEKSDPDENDGFIIEEEGKFGPTRKVNPKRRIAQAALANAKSLASEFGFTPASRSKIAALLAGAAKPEKDDFAEFEEME